jgi:N-acetylmuramoyl-L-alanine amidase
MVKLFKNLQLLSIILFSLNAYGVRLNSIEELEGKGESRGRRIIEAKDYYENRFAFDTTKPCTGSRCFAPGTIVYCSSYTYVGSSPRRKFAFCNIEKIKLPNGTEQVTPKRLTMMAGTVDYDASGKIIRIDNGAPANTTFEANLKGQVLPIALDETPAPRPKPKQTEAAATCEDCEVDGPAAALAKQGTEIARRTPPGRLNVTCNANQTADTCQLCNCYHESRGESFLGKVAVIRTVLARVGKSFPGSSSVCNVIFAHKQFSWTSDRVSNNINSRQSGDIEAYNQCKEALVLAKQRGPGTGYFYNPRRAAPRWARSMKICATIDNHRFVVPKAQSCPANLTTNPTSFFEKVLENLGSKEKV